jgi:hypothetical protein
MLIVASLVPDVTFRVGGGTSNVKALPLVGETLAIPDEDIVMFAGGGGGKLIATEEELEPCEKVNVVLLAEVLLLIEIGGALLVE